MVDYEDGAKNWNWPTSRKDQRQYLASLKLKKEDLTAYRSALQKVVYVVHQKTGISNIDRVTTCGSMGKGTACSKSFDLDLVVYLKDLDPTATEISSKIGEYLRKIKEKLDEQYPGTRDEDWYEKYSLHYSIKGMEIDILIGFEDVTPLDFLSIENESTRQFMSASVSHLACKFIKKQSFLYKGLVSVVKEWRDSYKWPKKPKTYPKSYLLEILLLEAFRRHKKRIWRKRRNIVLSLDTAFEAFGGYVYDINTEVLIEFFDMIGSIGQKNNDPLKIYFEEYYDKEDIPWDMVFEKKRKKKKNKTTTTLVLDPANPTNNLWFTLENQDLFIKRARETLKKLQGSEDYVYGMSGLCIGVETTS